MQVERIRSHEYQRQRWRNGLGWTREIARGGPEGEFDWRVSIAEIDRDCPFSAFPGCQRVLALLSGNGMQLEFADGRRHDVLPPHGRVAFAGDQPLQCRLLDGPTEDFNLMWRPARVHASLHHRPLVGSMVFFAEPDTDWLVYLLAGGAHLKDEGSARLQQGDSLHLRSGHGERRRLLLEGAGELFCVRISPAGPAAP